MLTVPQVQKRDCNNYIKKGGSMNIQEEIVTWLHTPPDRQQKAALRILTKGSLDETDISALVS